MGASWASSTLEPTSEVAAGAWLAGAICSSCTPHDCCNTERRWAAASWPLTLRDDVSVATTLVRVNSDACPDPPLPPLKLLLEGPPKIGKTTAMRCLVELLREHGAAVSGFVTHEIREHDQRVGFVVHDLDGPEGVLAHQDFRTGVQVGRFGVDVPAFERVALPALRHAQQTGGMVIIDELGRMELASAPFVEAVDALLAGSLSVVATVHVYEHPVTDALKRRADVQRVAVTEANRDELPAQLFRQLMRSGGLAD